MADKMCSMTRDQSLLLLLAHLSDTTLTPRCTRVYPESNMWGCKSQGGEIEGPKPEARSPRAGAGVLGEWAASPLRLAAAHQL